MVIIDLPLIVIDVRGTLEEIRNNYEGRGNSSLAARLGPHSRPAVLGEVRQAFRNYTTGDGDCCLL